MYLRLYSFSTNYKVIFKKQFWFRINQSTNDAIITLDEFFFSIYTINTFHAKSLQSPGTYLSERTWDPSQKAITK